MFKKIFIIALPFLSLRSLGRKLKSHKYWLAKYGRPASLSVAAWCDHKGVTLAVPFAKPPSEQDIIMMSITWGSILSPKKVVVQPSQRKSDCYARFERDFFNMSLPIIENGNKPNIIRSTDAWLARATHFGCRGHTIITEEYQIHSNRFSLTGMDSTTNEHVEANVLVSCACSNEEKETDCTASARWENEFLSTADFPYGGYALNVATIVGSKNDINILPDHERRFYFESFGNPNEYLWPMNCHAVFTSTRDINVKAAFDPGSDHPSIPLVIAGCPVSEKLDFRVHALMNGQGIVEDNSLLARRKGHLGFSLNAVIPESLLLKATLTKSDIMVSIQCQMIGTNEFPQLSDFCNQRIGANAPVESSNDESNNSRRRPTTAGALFAKLEMEAPTNKRPSANRGQSMAESDPIGNPHSRKEKFNKEEDGRRKHIHEGMHNLLNRVFKNRQPRQLADGNLFKQYLESNPDEDSVAFYHPPDRSNGPSQSTPQIQPAQTKYRAPVIQSIKEELSIGDWSQKGSRDFTKRKTGFQLGRNEGVTVGGEIGIQDRSIDLYSKLPDLQLTRHLDLSRREGTMGVERNGWGGDVGVNLESEAMMFNLKSPYVGVGTMANFLDRNYGARFRIRDFEISARHDFDEYLNPDPLKLATDFSVSWRSFGIGVGADVADNKYGVGVALSGYQVSILRDFDARQTDFVGNWGDGWQAFLSADMPDKNSKAMSAKVGLGNKKRSVLTIGGGLTESGLPELFANWQSQTGAINFKFDGKDISNLITGISFGRTTFVWDNKLALDNLDIPIVLRN